MPVNLLPVAERELRVAARGRGTYWVRSGSALSAIALAILTLLVLWRQTPVEQAEFLFTVLSSLAFAYALVVGVFTTSDCISEEKREGTLGLLFLTTLRGHDVVAGKLVASSLRAVSGWVAVLPVMAVPLLMGAVSGERVRNSALALGNTLFLSLALGMVVSVVVRDPRRAVGGSILALLALLGLLPLLRWLLVQYLLRPFFGVVSPSFADESLLWTLYPNPLAMFFWSGAIPGALTRGSNFWTALAVQHAIAWGFLVIASLLITRTWREKTRGERTSAGAKFVRRFGMNLFRARETSADPRGTAGSRGPEEFGPDPFAWIVAREKGVRRNLWVGLGVIVVAWGWGYWELRGDWIHCVVAIGALFVGGLWLKVQLAGMACRHFQEHRRTGAWELVLCTDQTPESLVRGFLAGLRWAIWPPMAFVVATTALLMIAALGRDAASMEVMDLVLTFIAGAGILVLDLWAMAWCGMWTAISSNGFVRAWSLTVGQVLFLPWALYLAGLMALGIAAEFFEFRPSLEPGYREALIGWIAVCVGIDGLLIGVSRIRLLSSFRDLAIGHYRAPSGKPS